MDEAAAEPRTPDSVHRYGPHPSQYAELYLPAARTQPGVVVIIHGGFWRDAYDAGLGRPLATDLAARGWVVWNLEYRRVPDPTPTQPATGSAGTATRKPSGGTKTAAALAHAAAAKDLEAGSRAPERADDQGGWPETFEDVSAGIDLLGPVLAGLSLEPGRVVALGHSAGGHLAVWAAGRHKLPTGTPGAGPQLAIDGVVSQAGVLELWMAHWLKLSHGAPLALMGVEPKEDPRRWQLADPARMLPIGVPVIALHGKSDADVPPAVSRAYTDAARAVGDPARLVWTTGDHHALITPGTPAWDACVKAISELTGQTGG